MAPVPTPAPEKGGEGGEEEAVRQNQPAGRADSARVHAGSVHPAGKRQKAGPPPLRGPADGTPRRPPCCPAEWAGVCLPVTQEPPPPASRRYPTHWDHAERSSGKPTNGSVNATAKEGRAARARARTGARSPVLSPRPCTRAGASHCRAESGGVREAWALSERVFPAGLSVHVAGGFLGSRVRVRPDPVSTQPASLKLVP